MQISVEKVIQIVTAEVLKELKKLGVDIVSSPESVDDKFLSRGVRTKSEILDMSKYHTPILTENHIRKLHDLTGEIIVPGGTIVTPKARELIKEKRILITIDKV